jgi:hypothetical protein
MIRFYQHPEFKQNYLSWQKYEDFFNGDNETIKKYLHRYALEDNSVDGKKAWEQRLGRSYYVNFCEPIISIWISLLFKKPANISQILDVFTEEELENIDGNNTPLDLFIRNFATQYLKYGKAFMFVDAPQGQSQSAEQDAELGLRPYGEIWTPLEVPDWEIETINAVNRGEFTAVHQQFIRIPPRASLSEQPRLELIRREAKLTDQGYQITIYKAQNEQLSTSNMTPEMLFALGLQPETAWVQDGEPVLIPEINQIPLVEGDDRSWLKEVQPLCERYYNLDSNHDNIIYFQGYARIAIATNQTLASIMPASESTMMRLPEGATVTQITAEDPTASEKNRADIRNMIFRVGLNQPRQLDGSSQQVQSAETIREEREFTLALAKETVSDIENLVNQFVEYWAMFKRRSDYEGKIELNKDFSSEDYAEFIQLYTAFSDRRALYPTASKQLDKMLIEYLKVPETVQAEINKEIDAVAATVPTATSAIRNTLLGNI